MNCIVDINPNKETVGMCVFFFLTSNRNTIKGFFIVGYAILGQSIGNRAHSKSMGI